MQLIISARGGGGERGESEAVVTMMPSPAARGVVVGGNWPCYGHVEAGRGKLEVASENTPIRCQGVSKHTHTQHEVRRIWNI